MDYTAFHRFSAYQTARERKIVRVGLYDFTSFDGMEDIFYQNSPLPAPFHRMIRNEYISILTDPTQMLNRNHTGSILFFYSDVHKKGLSVRVPDI